MSLRNNTFVDHKFEDQRKLRLL